MNTADITCVKITEKNNKQSVHDNELHILHDIRDDFSGKRNKYGINWYDRVYLCYEYTNFTPANTYSAIKGFNCYKYNSFTPLKI